MASDNIIDGIGIAVAYQTDPILGIVVTLAVAAHEVPQGMTSALVMKAGGYSLLRIWGVLSLAAVMYPIGASLSLFVPENLHRAAIALVAGIFLYIGAAAFMTEAHRKFNIRVILFLLAGSALALGLKFIE
jgi:zinc and cadmium transporter